MSTKPTPLAAMLEDLAAELVRLKEENARLRAALKRCESVFRELSNHGHYPEPLLGTGWKFIEEAEDDPSEDCRIDSERIQNMGDAED